MMIRVRGKEHPWREGMTVADLLKELNDPYPYAVVRINSSVISRPNFVKTAIPDGAEIFLIPMIAGG
jgi:thiamine biosynthesis protein ThiS